MFRSWNQVNFGAQNIQNCWSIAVGVYVEYIHIYIIYKFCPNGLCEAVALCRCGGWGRRWTLVLWQVMRVQLVKLSAGPSIQSEAQSRVGKNQWQNWVEEDQGSGADSGNSVWNQLSTWTRWSTSFAGLPESTLLGKSWHRQSWIGSRSSKWQCWRLARNANV